jgi:hypothetical protein
MSLNHILASARIIEMGGVDVGNTMNRFDVCPAVGFSVPDLQTAYAIFHE